MKKRFFFLPFLFLLSVGIVVISLTSDRQDSEKNINGEHHTEEGKTKGVESQKDKKDNIGILIDSAISSALDYYKQGGYPNAWKIFKDANHVCQVADCDKRIYLWPYIDNLLEAINDIDHFSTAIRSLGLFREESWTKVDIDGDGRTEVLALVKDWEGRDPIQLLIVKKVGADLLPNYYRIRGVEYIYDQLKVTDITGDSLPEILVFAGLWRGGANLYAFNFTDGKISQVFKKDNIFYPTYTFRDVDSDDVLEIIVEGYSSGPMPAFFKCPPCKEEKVRQVIKFIKEEESFKVISEGKLAI